MPGILGGMIAWTVDGEFHPGYFLLVMLGLTLNHLALNMTDDYFDFHHLVDVYAKDGGNPYTGGSGLLSVGLIQPYKMRQVFITFYIIAIGINNGKTCLLSIDIYIVSAWLVSEHLKLQWNGGMAANPTGFNLLNFSIDF